MPCDEIIVALVRNPAIAIRAKELRQVTCCLAFEVKRRLLRAGLHFRFRAKRGRPLDGLLSGGKVVIEQDAGSHLRRAVIVEAIGTDLGGKVRAGIPPRDVQSQQIADGVSILEGVEPPQHRVRSRGFETLRGIGDGLRDRIDRREQFWLLRVLFFLRRHVTLIELIENVLPKQGIVRVLDLCGESIKAHVAFLLLSAVAVDAVGFEELGGRSGGCD